jgi:hypothetical protein
MSTTGKSSSRREASDDSNPETQVWTVGRTVTFAEDPNPFTIQAVSTSGRWIACTRGWNQWDIDEAHRDGLAELFNQDLLGGWPDLGDCVYTVLDLERGLRGEDNAIGSLGYETREACERAIALLESGEFEYSRRSQPIPLNMTQSEPA